MSSYSPYAVAESQPPQWKPGENSAAVAFIAITLYIVLDSNVGIWRVFQKRKGLYYWAMTFGISAVAVNAIAVVIKYMVPSSGYVWPLYTTLMLVSWTIYAPAQLLVLYSRLHLVNQSHRIQRGVLIMILSTLVWLILPSWIVVWPGYDIDARISSLWSPRDAIVERYTQIGFTLVESAVSGIYIWSLLEILSFKPTVRQRRVLVDVIYVNVIIITCDMVIVILVYLNRLGISHPMQTFSYALKLKLEFVVLNQLMAIAARGQRKESFEERRYHHPSTGGDFHVGCRQWNDKPTIVPRSQSHTQSADIKSGSTDSAHITVPSPVLSKSHPPPAASSSGLQNHELMQQQRRNHSTNRDDFGDHIWVNNENVRGEPDLSISCSSEDRTSNKRPTESFRVKPSRNFSEETMQISPPSLRGNRHGVRESDKEKTTRAEGAIKRRFPGKRKDNVVEEEDEEIGVHMWEKGGKVVLEIPWFKTVTEA